MKNFIFGMAMFCLCFSASAATDSADEKVITAASNYFQTIAAKLGYSDYAHGHMGRGKGFVYLEYVPRGEKVESWTRMMNVTTMPLPTEEGKALEVMRKLVNGYGSYVPKQGKIISTQNYTDSDNFPLLYIEYEIGEGVMMEHTAAIVSRVGRASAVIQIQRRGNKRLAPADIAAFRGLFHLP